MDFLERFTHLMKHFWVIFLRILKRLKNKFTKFAIVPRKAQRGKTIGVI